MMTGCLTQTATKPDAMPGAALGGNVHGGNQAVVGAKVYLYAVSQSNYAGPAFSVLNSPGYVTTGTDGSWSISGDYTCPAGAYVYLLALGGNPGLTAVTNNPDLAMMTGLGPCSSLSTSQYYVINEVTTMATAYALSAFMTTETNVGTSTGNVTGLANAFAMIPNMVNLTTGAALATTPAGNGIVPQTTINSLANALVPCVNSNGVGAPCSTLMTVANVASSGTPVDTAQAAINIAHTPGTNVTAIYGLTTPNPAFQPALAAAPNDFTICLQYAPTVTGALNYAQGMAVDASGNIWVASFNTASILEFSPVGAQLSAGSGITNPSIYKPQGIALDSTGNVWFVSRANGSYADSVQKYSPTAGFLSGATGYTGGGLSTPRGLAIDAAGNVWAGGNAELSEFTSAGVPVSGATGYTGGGLQTSTWSLAIDASRNVWATGFNLASQTTTSPSVVTAFQPVSVALNNQGTYGGSFKNSTGYGTSSLNYAQSVAIDAGSNVWVANAYNGGTANGIAGSVSEFSNAGTLLSPTYGYTNGGVAQPQSVDIDGSGNVFTSQSQVGEVSNTGAAVAPSTGYQSPNQNDCCLAATLDSSGNYWLGGGSYIYQIVGIATPVVTPKVLALTSGKIGARP